MIIPENLNGNSGWFTKARFGMFMTWGVYALPAQHECMKKRECFSHEAYLMLPLP